jgi:hypothetical protein
MYNLQKMFDVNSRRLIGFLLAALCAFAGPAHLSQAASIQTPWQTNAYGVIHSTNIAADMVAGYHFTPLVNGQVVGLGGLFNGTKTVKLFNKATGAVLATATVSAANVWSYAAIMPVNVTSGTTYTVAVYLAGSGASENYPLNPGFPQTFGNIRIEGNTHESTATNPTIRPTNTWAYGMFGQADIQFVPTPPTQTPWQTNAYGTLSTNIAWNYAMGYHFTPLVNGQVTGLGGYFNGTKTVKLFNKATGALLASATVTASNAWSYTSITPVNITANTAYTVAVYLAGSGGSYRSGLSPALPRTFGDIRMEGSTYAYTASDPNARPTNATTTTVYGQADIRFVPGTTPPDTTPPTINALSPQPGPTLYAGNTVTLSASVTDTDPSPLEYQFSVDGVIKQAWSATTTYQWVTTSAMAGSHIITAEVRDAGGAVSKTQTLYLYLKPPGLP